MQGKRAFAVVLALVAMRASGAAGAATIGPSLAARIGGFGRGNSFDDLYDDVDATEAFDYVLGSSTSK